MKMIKSEQINNIVEAYLEGTDKFVVKLTVSKDNLINLFVDGDHGITIDDCVKLSRHIENSLNRDEEDFELRVSSAGIDLPYMMLRQYTKNIGRKIEAKLKDGTKKRGELVSADSEKIEIIEDIKGKGKKKKIVPGEKLEIPMSEIMETKSIIVI